MAEPVAVTSMAVRLASAANVLLPGTYAWGATVASPGFASGGGARVAAGAALAALWVGAGLAPFYPRVGRALGITVFAGASLLTWTLARDAISVERIDAVRGCLGGLGWLLTMLGWGAMRAEAGVPAGNAHARPSPLEPRRSLPLTSWLLVGVAFSAAAGPLVAAWSVARAEHALLAQAAAVLAAIALVTVGGLAAVERNQASPVGAPSVRLRGARGGLALLVLGLSGGLLWRLFA